MSNIRHVYKNPKTIHVTKTCIKKAPRVRWGFKRGCTSTRSHRPNEGVKSTGKESIHKTQKIIYTPNIRDHHTQPKGTAQLFLEHLVTAAAADFIPDALPDGAPFLPLDPLTPAQTLNAQIKTSEWLSQFDDDDETILGEEIGRAHV